MESLFWREGGSSSVSLERGSVERSSFERVSVERSSLERGVSLVESVLAFAVVGVFILGGLYLFGQASHNTRMNEMGTHLAYAMEEVRGANPTGRFKGTSARRWSRYIPAGGETPHGKIRVALDADDPGDAFRLLYEDIPAAAIEEICEPLRQRIRQSPDIDRSSCASLNGVSHLEIRIRRAEVILTARAYEDELPDCGVPCRFANWRGEPPPLEDMRRIKKWLDVVERMRTLQEIIKDCPKAHISDCSAFDNGSEISLGEGYSVEMFKRGEHPQNLDYLTDATRTERGHLQDWVGTLTMPDGFEFRIGDNRRGERTSSALAFYTQNYKLSHDERSDMSVLKQYAFQYKDMSLVRCTHNAGYFCGVTVGMREGAGLGQCFRENWKDLVFNRITGVCKQS